MILMVDLIEKKYVKIACCPTENMVADYSAKPTQGSLFAFQGNVILGLNEKNLECTRSA